MDIPKKIRHLIIVLLIGSTLALLYKFREVLPIFILAVFVAYILTPLVIWMSSKTIFKRRIPRGAAIIVIYLMLITGVSFGGAYFFINLTNELQTLIKDIPKFEQTITKSWVPAISRGIENISRYLPKVERAKQIEDEHEEEVKEAPYSSSNNNEIVNFLNTTKFEIKQSKNGFEVIPHKVAGKRKISEADKFNISQFINNFIFDFLENLQHILVRFISFGQTVIFSILSSVFQTFIILMVAAFIIIDHEMILNYIRGLFPNSFLNKLEIFFQRINTGLSGVVRGQLIICLVNGTLTGVGLFVFGIKFALTLSVVATVCSIIPIFGVIISSIPIVLMAITDSFLSGLLVLGWILLIHFIEGNILNPKIIGKSAEIHPVLVILALMAGEKTYGIFGAVIAVPIFSMLQTTFFFIREVVFGNPQVEEPEGKLQDGKART